jgi:hypothetical protein
MPLLIPLITAIILKHTRASMSIFYMKARANPRMAIAGGKEERGDN